MLIVSDSENDITILKQTKGISDISEVYWSFVLELQFG